MNQIEKLKARLETALPDEQKIIRRMLHTFHSVRD